MDYVFDLPGQHQVFFVHDLSVLYDIYSNVMVNVCQHVQVQHINVAFYFQNILFTHFVAAGIFYDSHGAVQLVQAQVFVDGQAFSGLDMVQHEAFLNFSHV